MLSAPLRSSSLPSLVEPEGAAPLHLTQLTDEPNDEDPAAAVAETSDLVIVSRTALSNLRQRLPMLQDIDRPSVDNTWTLDTLLEEMCSIGAELGRVINMAIPCAPGVQRAAGVSHPLRRDTHAGEIRPAWRSVDPRQPKRSQTLPLSANNTAQQRDHDASDTLALFMKEEDVPQGGLFGSPSPSRKSIDIVEEPTPLVSITPELGATKYIDGGDHVMNCVLDAF